MTYLLSTCAGIAVFTATLAHAGPVSDFESDFRHLYGQYRVSLFQTNSGEQQASNDAVTTLEQSWSSLTDAYADAPPPQYEDDPLWSDTITEVTRLVDLAQDEIAAGALPTAHETLELVRDQIGDLHRRNGIELFSDRMNAYHEEMEHILEMSLAEPEAVDMVREQAAILEHLADDVLLTPPPEAFENPEYEELSSAFRASVQKMVDAGRLGDQDALQAALAGLKPIYSKFFLKFG
jgi:hypothetical protein